MSAQNKAFLYILLNFLVIHGVKSAMTKKQLETSMATFRSICTPKFPALSADLLDGIKKGGWIEENKDLKCYVKCIAEMAGTTNKKGDIIVQKALAQVDTILPLELRDYGRGAIEACKNVGKGYKDLCDKAFYTTKCTYDFDPSQFFFP